MNYRNKMISSLIHQIRSLLSEVRIIKKKLYSSDPINIHSMEVKQDACVQSEILRREKLNEADLKTDLENQYGKTKWAERLIAEIVGKRFKRR